MERINERRWSQIVASYRYADVQPQSFKKTMNGLLTQLKNKTLIKYRPQEKTKHVVVIIFKMSFR